MATTITNECINCGACEPECPNTAIYAGGVPWELDGASGPAIAQDIYFIVPSKCTECVGFFDHEACAAVCPVDCCIPDPANVENEGVLLARARKLHPDETFPDDPPSRFRKPAVAPAAPAPAEAPKPAPVTEAPKPAAAPVAEAPAAPKPAPAPVAEAKPAAAAKPAAVAPAPVAAESLAMMRLPKDTSALPGPIGEKHFPGELEADFDAVLASVNASPVRVAPAPVQIAFR